MGSRERFFSAEVMHNSSMNTRAARFDCVLIGASRVAAPRSDGDFFHL
jgi:hypothetical protein